MARKKQQFKVRNKFSSLDLKYMASFLQQSLKGSLVNNIQDVTAKNYVFKLYKAGQKGNLLIESGVKLSLIEDKEEVSDKPNNFTQKLRKHLRSLFVEEVRQLGAERVIQISFNGADKSNKDFNYHLFLEFYSQGNIVLTDYQFKTICSLRVHEYSETQQVKVDFRYPIELAAPTSYKTLKENLQNFGAKINEKDTVQQTV